jgi:GNAT superfamily N-acetyltransferase
MSIHYEISPDVSNAALDALFAAAWPEHFTSDFQAILKHSLLWACAYADAQVVGFVNVAWDGGVHAFILDTTVHPDFQRQGIGVGLVQTAVAAAREHDIEWVHVDYEPHLEGFYKACGFQPTLAGLINLR